MAEARQYGRSKSLHIGELPVYPGWHWDRKYDLVAFSPSKVNASNNHPIQDPTLIILLVSLLESCKILTEVTGSHYHPFFKQDIKSEICVEIHCLTWFDHWNFSHFLVFNNMVIGNKIIYIRMVLFGSIFSLKWTSHFKDTMTLFLRTAYFVAENCFKLKFECYR